MRYQPVLAAATFLAVACAVHESPSIVKSDEEPMPTLDDKESPAEDDFASSSPESLAPSTSPGGASTDPGGESTADDFASAPASSTCGGESGGLALAGASTRAAEKLDPSTLPPSGADYYHKLLSYIKEHSDGRELDTKTFNELYDEFLESGGGGYYTDPKDIKQIKASSASTMEANDEGDAYVASRNLVRSSFLVDGSLKGLDALEERAKGSCD